MAMYAAERNGSIVTITQDTEPFSAVLHIHDDDLQEVINLLEHAKQTADAECDFCRHVFPGVEVAYCLQAQPHPILALCPACHDERRRRMADLAKSATGTHAR